MLQWLKSKFRRRWADDDPEWGMKAAEDLTASVMAALTLQFEAAECPAEAIPPTKEFFVAAYIAGFSDVIAQASGGKPGGSLSMTLAGRVLQKVFGNTHGDHMFNVIDRAMRSRNSACEKGLRTGAEDANLLLRRAPPMALFKYLAEEPEAETAMDAFVSSIYGDNKRKTADVPTAIALANDELLLGRFAVKDIAELATALNNGPVPYSTHDLAASVALGLLRKAPKERRKELFNVQLQARLTVGTWVTEGKIVAPLAAAFEQTLYKDYHPNAL